jgi:hypothetical protein
MGAREGQQFSDRTGRDKEARIGLFAARWTIHGTVAGLVAFQFGIDVIVSAVMAFAIALVFDQTGWNGAAIVGGIVVTSATVFSWLGYPRPPVTVDGCPLVAQTPGTEFVEESDERVMAPSLSPANQPLQPLRSTRHPSAGRVWGTRGPEFKSRRPDWKPAGYSGFSLGRDGGRSSRSPLWKPDGNV